jgi:hypothetical protein
MKELWDTIYNTTALVQNLIRTEEGFEAAILLYTWRTPAAKIADRVISPRYQVRHPLGVLATFEDGDLIFSWKNVKY